jgi:hypothetical protein
MGFMRYQVMLLSCDGKEKKPVEIYQRLGDLDALLCRMTIVLSILRIISVGWSSTLSIIGIALIG